VTPGSDELKIRQALASEAQVLSALVLDAKAHWGYAAAAIDAWRDELRIRDVDLVARPAFVASLDGEVAGFYSLAPSAHAWELDNLWVAPRFMRRGVGRTLVDHALETAFRGGASSVTVDADPNAESFYLSCGAARCGEVPAPIAGQPDRVRPQLRFT